MGKLSARGRRIETKNAASFVTGNSSVIPGALTDGGHCYAVGELVESRMRH